jgi:site-specific recombinase XerD
MDGNGVPEPAHRDRTRKPAGRRPRTIKLKKRGGYWYATGTLIAGGRTTRIRKSLGLPVATVSYRQAELALAEFIEDERARITGRTGRGDAVAVAALGYLHAPRARPLGASTIRIVKEIEKRFPGRRLNEIGAEEWREWVDGRMAGNKAETRERFLNGVVGFLNFAKRNHGLAELPAFERDQKARSPNRRARRRTEELRHDLLRALFDVAHISVRAQLAVEYATGSRVSSVLYGVRLCDLNLGKGREQITFRGTKNGEDVTAALNATAVTILKAYLKWRGKLTDREAPLFLTYRREPYADNGRSFGGQNKTAFRAAKRRAIAAIRNAAATKAAELLAGGKTKATERAAQAILDQAEADAVLVGRVTQHWFRHMLATRLLRKDPRAAMEQGDGSIFGPQSAMRRTCPSIGASSSPTLTKWRRCRAARRVAKRLTTSPAPIF